jgi:hypothetical protein
MGVEWNQDGTIRRCGELRKGKFARSLPVPRFVLPADSKHLTAAMQAAGPDILLLPEGGFLANSITSARPCRGDNAAPTE